MLPSDVLIQGGWIRNHLRDRNGGHCIVGAVVDSEVKYELIEHALWDLLPDGAKSGSEWWDIVTWNNCSCPNQETVVALTRQAEINLGLRPVEVELNERVAVPI